jgi:cell division septation protein DedD
MNARRAVRALVAALATILLATAGARGGAVPAPAAATTPAAVAAPPAPPATTPAAPAGTPPAGGPTAAPAPAKPEVSTERTVRIGLTTDNVRARVTADGGVLVRDPVKKTLIWKKVFDPGLTFVSEVSGHGPLLIYRVQIGSFATKEAAEEKQKAIETLLPAEKVVTSWNPDRRSWRVRAGEYRSRDEAATLSQRLADEGYREIWIVEEEAEAAGRRRVRLVDDRWHDFLTGGDRVLVAPAKSGAWLKVDQSAYRGALEVRVDRGGRLRVINELPMEDYLRGVVPNEMGPGVYAHLHRRQPRAVRGERLRRLRLGAVPGLQGSLDRAPPHQPGARRDARCRPDLGGTAD